MELNLFLDYVGNGLKEIIRDVERLHETPYYGSSDLLDRLSSHVVMLESHVDYFTRSNHLTMEEISYPHQKIQASQDQEPDQEPETEPEQEPDQEPEEQPPRYFTLEELSAYNGQNGAPAYVAVNGVVYDVTNNPLWKGGSHFGGLTAGKDLTNAFEGCHPGAMVLSVLPVVGYLTLV